MSSSANLYGLPSRNRQIAIVASLFILFAIPVTILASLQTRSVTSNAASCYDLDSDGIVNQTDIKFLQNQINTKSFTQDSDLNNDGKVEGADFEVLKKHVGETCSPKVSFFVDPDTTKVGGRATLQWSVTHANSVTIDGLGEVAKEGKKTLDVDFPITYRLTASGPGGSVVATTNSKIIP